MPKISVITVSYNAEKTIERTIQSVQSQTYDDFEYILVDGNSKDKTLEIAGKYKDFIKKWISEPDKGLYDAMNKGVLLAQGEYIVFLNADDVFASNDVLKDMAKHLDGHDIVYGNIDFHDLKTNEHNIRKQNYMNKAVLCAGTMFHPAEFIKRNLLENLGGFDLRFKIVADYEFNLRAILKNKAKIKYADVTVTVFAQGEGLSSNPEGEKKHQKEKRIVQKMYFTPIGIWWNTLLFKTFRSLLRTPLYKFFFQIGD